MDITSKFGPTANMSLPSDRLVEPAAAEELVRLTLGSVVIDLLRRGHTLSLETLRQHLSDIGTRVVELDPVADILAIGASEFLDQLLRDVG